MCNFIVRFHIAESAFRLEIWGFFNTFKLYSRQLQTLFNYRNIHNCITLSIWHIHVLVSTLNLGGITHNFYVLQLLCLVYRQWNIYKFASKSQNEKFCYNMHYIIHDFLLMKINWQILYKNMSSGIMIITNLISTI